MKPTMMKSFLCMLTCFVFIFLFLSIGNSQVEEIAKYPSRPTTFISPYQPGLGVVLAQQAAPAQQVPRVKGPRVWLDMDQKELDDAYDQSVYAPNQRQIMGRYVTNSGAARARLGPPLRLRSDPHRGTRRLHDEAPQRTN